MKCIFFDTDTPPTIDSVVIHQTTIGPRRFFYFGQFAAYIEGQGHYMYGIAPFVDPNGWYSYNNVDPNAFPCEIVNNIEDQENEILLSLYPNPSSHLINIDVEGNLEQDKMCHIFNSVGQKMFEFNCKPPTNPIFSNLKTTPTFAT